jgi:two-component system chemotaxis response regulator CheB
MQSESGATELVSDTGRLDKVRVVIIGGSAGGSSVAREILRALPIGYPLPIVLVQHLHPDDDGMLAENLGNAIALPVLEALDKMPALPGCVYIAPANYHLLVEQSGRFALSVDEPVRWSRPSIDLFFQSAAIAWRDGLLAVLLSGANEDGAMGIRTIRSLGGITVAQDPVSAQFPYMPQAAIDTGAVQHVLSPEKMMLLLKCLGKEPGHAHYS